MSSGTISNRRLTPLVTGAGEDLLQGAAAWDLWSRLGWLEVKRRYRRTVIGPCWSAISMGMFVLALGSLGAGLWEKGINEYMPFLAAGFVGWLLIAAIATESCSLFLGGSGTVGEVRFNYSVLVYALIWRNLIVLLHNFSVYLIFVLVLLPSMLKPVAAMAIPGLLIVVVNGIWVALLLGMFALRFRDVQQLVSSVVNIVMFITPIFWFPDLLPRAGMKRLVFVDFNPLFHLIDVVRAPLLGRLPAPESYIATFLMAVVGWAVTFVVFRHFRKRLAYWR